MRGNHCLDMHGVGSVGTHLDVGANRELLAGLPDDVPGMTVNRFCSSGLETINIAAGQIATGQNDVVIAGDLYRLPRQPAEEQYVADEELPRIIGESEPLAANADDAEIEAAEVSSSLPASAH